MHIFSAVPYLGRQIETYTLYSGEVNSTPREKVGLRKKFKNVDKIKLKVLTLLLKSTKLLHEYTIYSLI